MGNVSKTRLRNIFPAWFRALKLEHKNSPTATKLSIIVKITLSLFPFVQAYLFSLIVNLLVEYISSGVLDNNLLTKYIVIGIMISFVIAFLWKVDSIINDRIWKKNGVLFQQLIYSKVNKLDLETFETPKFHTDFNKVKDFSDWRVGNFIEVGKWMIFHDLLGILVSIAIIIRINPWFLLIIILISIPEVIISLKESGMKWGIWFLQPEIKNKYYDTLNYLSSENYFKEIRMFNLSDQLTDVIRNTSTNFLDSQFKYTKKSFWYTIPAKIIETIGLGFIQISLVQDIISKRIQIGDFGFINSTILEFAGKAKNFANNLIKIYDDSLYATDYFSILDIKSKLVYDDSGVKISTNKVPKIEFKDVSFKYPNTDKFIYQNLNLIINPGEDIALVGENGAGKTTFIKLLSRFYDVTTGQILVDGIDLKEINLESWHQHLGILFQDFNRYAYSVRENVELGLAGSQISDEILDRNLKLSGAKEFVDGYEKGAETKLSKSYNGGIEPSGGQWQRIALARAFYRNANILILDEPTSAIDAKGEYEIFQKIEEMQGEKTTIIISHRFSTVRNADKIYVIDNGKIIEKGTHEELLEVNGKYKQMFELQAEGYK